MQQNVVICEKCFLHLSVIRFVCLYRAGTTQLSAEPSLSTPRHQTAVELTWVKQTDQIWAVSEEIWSSSYSLCRWMGGIRCGFCTVFMIEVWTLNGLRLGQMLSPCTQGSQCACRDQCPSLLPSAAAGAFLHSPIYRLSRHSSAARIVACLIVLSCQVRPSNSTSGCPTDHPTSTKPLNQPHPRSSTRAAPSHTSVYIFDHRCDLSTPNVANFHQYSIPALAVLSASTLLSSIQQPFGCHRTPDCRVASVASALHTPLSNNSGAC